MLDDVVIRWDRRVFIYHDLDAQKYPSLESQGFYTLLAARWQQYCYKDFDLLFIGSAYKQSIRGRLEDGLPDGVISFFDKHIDMALVVRAGVVFCSSILYGSKRLFDDIESALAYTNQPRFNQSKDGYGGRPLMVTNDGDFKPLRRTLVCYPGSC